MENTSDILKLYPLSHMQEGMLFHSLMDNQSNAYFEQIFFTINGKLDIELLEKSFNCLIDRHDIFRTNFVSEKVKQPVQVVFKQKKANIYFEDISDIDEVEKGKHIKNYIIKDRKKGFNLLKDMLVRLAVIKTKKNTFRIIWSHHHILLDGWCLGIVVKELMDIYIALKEEKELCLNKVYPYSDYINWLQKKDKGQAIKYWEEYLKGYEQKAVIPRSLTLKKDIKYDNKDYVFKINKKDTDRLKQFANENEITLNNVFQSIWGILLQKYNNVNDVVYGAVVSGRPSEIDGIESMVGLFINTVPVRINCNQNTSFIELVEEVKKASILNANNDYVPLADIQVNTYLNQELMDHIIAFENYPLSKEFGVWGDSQESKISITDIDVFEQTNYDFDIVIEMGSQLSIKLSYNSYMFEDSFIKSIEGHLKNIIDKVMDEPNVIVEDIEIITELEKKQILFEYNDTKSEYPKNKTIHQLFEEQVEKTPDNIAVSYEDKSLSYRELNHKANMIARLLREKGIGPDDIVGILVERSIEMIVGILGVLKAGGAYLPIDTIYPQERVEYMLQNSGCRILLTEYNYIRKVSFSGELLMLEDNSLYKGDTSNIKNINKPENLAYMIYTSGSTGKPKGVMIEHKSLINYIDWASAQYIKGESVSMPLYTSISFDLTITSIFLPLITGNQIIVYKEDSKHLAIEKVIDDNKVEIMKLTPAHLNLIKDREYANSKLKRLIVGGDQLESKLASNISEILGVEIFNEYGPTEATVGCMIYKYNEENDKSIAVPIGKPINNVKLYIIDKNNELVTENIAGELCIAGDGLARGYLNRPELNSEKFIDNPFVADTKMYRTGDLVRRLSGGNIEFLGRIDHQVKIRGFRIELGEIETKLMNHGEIDEAVVIAKEDLNGQKYLCAYIVSTGKILISELRGYLSKDLPDYMIPSYFVELEKIPITINGKVDRKSLPEPEENIDSGTIYVAPTNYIEEKLVELWKEILGIEEIGVKHNFFEIGGHSLKAIVVCSRIKKEFGVDISLKGVFEHRTIEELAKVIKFADNTIYSSIKAIEVHGDELVPFKKYPVSAAQKRLFVLWQLEGMSTTYNLPGAMLIEGNLDWKKFEKSFQKLIKRHESLRTSFEMIENDYYQIVHKSKEFKIEYEEQNEETLEMLMKEFIRPFDLSEAPLLRIKLINQGSNKHLMLFDMHHIISDGVSVNIIIQEFTNLYQDIELPELRIQYKDYSNWQKELLESKEIEKQEKHWLDVFKGEIPVLDLPTDYPRPSFQSFEGDKVLFRGEKELLEKLNSYATNKNYTLYMLLLGAYNVLLSKYSLQEDIIVGSPIAGRPHADLQNIIGMFVNTLGIRNFPSNNKKFDEFLEEVKQNTLNAFENQDYQFEQIIEKLEIRRDTSRNPLFDVMFVMQNMGNFEFKIPNLKFTNYDTNIGISKFDLTLIVEEKQEYLEFEFEYCSKLFDKETIQRMGEHYLNILRQIVREQDKKISTIELATKDEREQILLDFNNTKKVYENNITIQHLFEEQVNKTPENIAVVYEDNSLSYRQLNEKANQVARVLRSKGINVEDIVGICVERSLEMIVGIMAILKAGGAYLPIDPEYPKDRIQYMLDDSKVKMILTQASLESKLPNVEDAILLDDTSLYSGDNTNLEILTNSKSLAYVIYTSGTTGKPKGVMLEHKGMVNLELTFRNRLKISKNDSVIQFASSSFDAFTWEVFMALLNGAELHVLNGDIIKDPNKLEEYIINNSITTITLPPTYLINLKPEKLKSLKRLVSAGSDLSKDLVHKWKSFTTLINAYGPTEGTICATMWIIEESANYNIVPIGNGIINVKIYIVDKYNNLCGIGIPGELCISSEGLARGYQNREELTAEKFVDNPFEIGKRMYRTGDLARWLPDGNIEFIGRIDQQVKIRGYRIELGEIENKLLEHEYIKEAVVIAKDFIGSDKQLCAYVVLEDKNNDKQEITTAEIREHLSKDLPKYMIPVYIIVLDKMPLNPNGKIDRKLLPNPSKELSSQIEYVAPRNEVEEKMLNVWRQVLGVEEIGIKDDFFDNGGDSIKAAQVTSRLRQHNIFVEVKELFTYSNIGDLYTCVKDEVKDVNQAAVTGEISFTPIQKWFISQNFSEMHHFNQAVMLYTQNKFDETIVMKAFNKIIEHHDALRIILKIHENEVIQFNRDVEDNLFDLEVIDLTQKNDIIEKIEEHADRIQGEISLTCGPLVKLGLFKSKQGDHLLIAIHHLVIDGVSWRIIIEDFNSTYKQIREGILDVRLPQKTNSYMEWSQAIKEYSNRVELLNEVNYWKELEEKYIVSLPKDREVYANRNIDSKVVSVDLTTNETKNLLKKINNVYKTEIMDILLTALGLTVRDWTGEDNVLINLEGHGREDIVNDIDVTRTVGWFTSSYPVVLDMCEHNDIRNSILAIKQIMRNIPKKGVGYGILRYITSPENKTPIKFNLKPEISFNYLGQFDQDFKTEIFNMSGISNGETNSPQGERLFRLDISAMVIQGKLTISLNYNKEEYREETVDKIISGYKNNLLGIIEHCNKIGSTNVFEDRESCKKNYSEVELLDSVLEDVKKELTIQNKKFENKFLHDVLDNQLTKTYTLSGVQKYHLIEPEFAGVVIKFDTGLDIKILEKSILDLINTHEVLRSVIVEKNNNMMWEEHSCPNHISIPLLDLYKYNVSTQKMAINFIMSEYYFYREYKKYNTLQYRVVLIKQSLNDYMLLMPFNHIIFDAISGEIIKRDLLTYYEANKNKKELPKNKSKTTSEYINQVKKGPQGINEQEIIEIFKLKESEQELIKLHKRIDVKNNNDNCTWYNFEIETNYATDNDMNLPWKVSFALLNAYCREYLNITRVPIRMVNNGRRLENISYYNNVGDFADHVPMLIDNEKCDVLDLAEYVQDKINIASKHNITFANLIFDEELREKYKIIYPLVKNQLFNSPVLFNYQGKYEDEDIETFNELLVGNNFDKYKKLIKEKKWIAFFVKYSANAIKIVVALPYEVNEKELECFLQSESKKIMGRLTE